MLLAHLSGLIHASTKVHVTGLDKIEDNETIFQIYSNIKFAYEYDTRTDLYEYPTLKKLEAFCLHNNQSLVWYAHSKGASYENTNAVHWRDIMNYFILDKWHHYYDLLSTTNYTPFLHVIAIIESDGIRIMLEICGGLNVRTLIG